MWVIVLLVVLLYVRLFNVVAPMYLESEGTLTIVDLWNRVFTS
jgi:hypothetical protein